MIVVCGMKEVCNYVQNYKMAKIESGTKKEEPCQIIF